MKHKFCWCLVLMLLSAATCHAEIRVGVFDVDASPPVGSPLAYDPTKGVQSPLSCRGIVILGSDRPIVMCAVDWIGISNGGQTFFKEHLAQAAQTTTDLVVVHTLHQHDAPRCDFTADELLSEFGISGAGFDPAFARDVVHRAADAVKQSVKSATTVTALGVGEGLVEKVASNRRILGEDGKVLHTRYTATKDPKIRAMPTGTIDPKLKLISFWNNESPIVALTYYATHPQSYYRTGLANPDFPGMARNQRQNVTRVPHIHFNGAGGNIGAGKWNDGSPENRQVLADRVAAGMEKAWKNTERQPIQADHINWQTVAVVLPIADHVDEKTLYETLADPTQKADARYYAAKNLAWARRCAAQDSIPVSCLTLGDARILHMPGELFVEYQLNAQQLRPDLFVAMAAYGDYAPGYIGTQIAYGQGGYETSERASRVAPLVENVLMDAVRTLLRD